MRRLALCAVFALAVGCRGAEGPMGPAGPQGAQGIPGIAGPGNRLTYTGALDASGAGIADLPASAGTIANPPLFACYLLFSVNGVPTWFPTGDLHTPGEASCVLGTAAGTAILRIVVGPGTVGQGYAITVVY